MYAEADADPEAWWDRHARALDWDEPWHTVLDWSDKPFAKWYVGGKLNASYNCVDRHVAAGYGDRVAFYWRGEEGEELEPSPTLAARAGPARGQRPDRPRASGRGTSSASTCP